MINNNFAIVLNKDLIKSELEGETVILNLTSGTYYGLNETGTTILNLLEKKKNFQEIQEAILSEYDVAPELCESQVKSLLQDFADKGLIEIKDAATV